MNDQFDDSDAPAVAKQNIDRADEELRAQLRQKIIDVNNRVPIGNIANGDAPVARMNLVEKLGAAIQQAILSGKLAEDVVAQLTEMAGPKGHPQLRWPEDAAVNGLAIGAIIGRLIFRPIFPFPPQAFQPCGCAQVRSRDARSRRRARNLETFWRRWFQIGGFRGSRGGSGLVKWMAALCRGSPFGMGDWHSFPDQMSPTRFGCARCLSEQRGNNKPVSRL